MCWFRVVSPETCRKTVCFKTVTDSPSGGKGETKTTLLNKNSWNVSVKNIARISIQVRLPTTYPSVSMNLFAISPVCFVYFVLLEMFVWESTALKIYGVSSVLAHDHSQCPLVPPTKAYLVSKSNKSARVLV